MLMTASDVHIPHRTRPPVSKRKGHAHRAVTFNYKVLLETNVKPEYT